LLLISIASFLLVTLLPFCVFYETYAGIDSYLFTYFNGRLKWIDIEDGVRSTMTYNPNWLGIFPLEIWLLMIIGLGIVLLASVYKLIAHDREDKKITSIMVFIGGILGLIGVILFPINYYNSYVGVYMVTQLIYGFYIAIVIFSIHILLGIGLFIDALKNPQHEEEIDLIDKLINKT
ncbi:MAG: hypothetical protein ACFFDW_17510, partial [Candidatus Thorarchaeota archaeon]